MKNHLAILFISIILASCAITDKKNNYTGTRHNNKGAVRVVAPSDHQVKNSGIIYGNIQTKSPLKGIVIHKVLPNGKVDIANNIKSRTFDNGNFIIENLESGSYIISSVDTKSISMDIFTQENEIQFYQIQVNPGEAVYAGTFKIVTSKFKNADDKINVTVYRSPIPTEKNILRHVSTVEHNTTWSRSLKLRMQELI